MNPIAKNKPKMDWTPLTPRFMNSPSSAQRAENTLNRVKIAAVEDDLTYLSLFCKCHTAD